MSVRGSGARFPADRQREPHVRIDYLCRVCASADPPVTTILHGHAVSTTHKRFEDETIWQTATDVSESQITHQRYKFDCPRCPNTPVVKRERFVAALKAVYQPGRHAVIEHLI